MSLDALIGLTPLATFWVAFNSIIAASKFAHDFKERLIESQLPVEYKCMLRDNTRDLCLGVVMAIMVFAAALGCLASALWSTNGTASVLLWLEFAFCIFAAWAFGAGSIRFFRAYTMDAIRAGATARNNSSIG